MPFGVTISETKPYVENARIPKRNFGNLPILNFFGILILALRGGRFFSSLHHVKYSQ